MNDAETKRTVCNRDCPDACSILVEVENGVAKKLRGDPDDPVTHGFLCERTSKFLGRQYSDDRFRSPMRRVNGELQAISWDEALNLAATKLLRARADFGGASILDYRSGGSLGQLTRMPSHLLSIFGPVTTKAGDICSGAGEAAQEADMGLSESHDIFDLLNSRLILVWGKNVHTSSVHLLPILKQAQEQGARLVGMDVRETKSKSLCDEFTVVRPGGDLSLAMGLARRIFDLNLVDPRAPEFCDHFDAFSELVHQNETQAWAERAGVSLRFVESLGEAIATLKPVSFQIGWGMSRRKFGAATVRAIDALAAISGNIGIAGGGANFCYRRSDAFDIDFGLTLPEPPRQFLEPLLGEEILRAKEPEIRVAWITAGNPVAMLPDSHVVKEALASRDFVVVVDTHPSDTTDVADLILPTTTLLEDDDLLGAFGNHYLRASTPAIKAPDGCWHELKIVQELAARLGLAETFQGSIRDWKERGTQRIRASGYSLADLHREACRNRDAQEVLFEGQVFATPNGRFQLMTELPPWDDVDQDFPLRLLATSSPKAQSSQWSVDPKGLVNRLGIHPGSCGDLADGATAWLESRQGRMLVTVCHDESIHPEVAHLPKGGTFRQEACSNSLVKAMPTDAGGGAAYYDEPVRLRPASVEAGV